MPNFLFKHGGVAVDIKFRLSYVFVAMENNETVSKYLLVIHFLNGVLNEGKNTLVTEFLSLL